jgi:hypothetical protein
VNENRIQAGLTRPKHPTGSGRESEEKTGAEHKEERSGHDKVVASEDETHSASDETVHKEEHESVKEYGHLTCFSVHERNLGAVGSQKKTGAQSQKKSGGDGNLLGCKVWEHLIYTHIIFRKVGKIIKRCTTQHLFMETIIVYTAPDISPNVSKSFFIPHCLLLIFPCCASQICVMFNVTKFDKITKTPCMLNLGIIQECTDIVPHVA